MKLHHLLLLLLCLGITHESMAQKQGRRGNALYKQEQYEAAADAYYTGLNAYQGGKTDLAFHGLQNNLGAALHKQQEFDLAQAAFARALETAASVENYARAAYNAGNNAFRLEQAEAALEHYKKALLADPTNQDAKFNYEFVKRQLEQQQQQNQQSEDQNQENDQNQDQNQDQQQNQDQPQDQNQDQNQDQQQNQDQPQDQNQNQPPPPEPSEQLSRQQAERILQALENEEEQLLREVQKVKGRPRRVEKDW